MPLKTVHKTGCISLNAAFCRLALLQLPSDQKDIAEVCGSRIGHYRARAIKTCLAIAEAEHCSARGRTASKQSDVTPHEVLRYAQPASGSSILFSISRAVFLCAGANPSA